MNPVVVIPIARMDHHLAVKLLTWMRLLALRNRDRTPYTLVAYCSPALTKLELFKVLEAAPDISVGVQFHLEIATDVNEREGYFGCACAMFLGALLLVERKFAGAPMLWIEADCCVMRETWYAEVAAEYARCGKEFMGDHVRGDFDYMTGVGVYGPNWRNVAPSLLSITDQKRAWGWDSRCAKETFPNSHRAKTIQQIWRPPEPLTADWVAANIRPETAVFHQVKDGSLVDVLSNERIPLDAPLCESTYEKEKHLHGNEHHVAAGEGTSILIVTFARDIPFLRYCLLSVERYCSGFKEVVLCVPAHEREQFTWARNVRLVTFDEPAGKGMMAHEREIMRADEICEGAARILHLDADVCFWKPTTPKDYTREKRVLNVCEPYTKIGNPNRHIWKDAVRNAVGIEPGSDFMVRHPAVHIREVYAKARELIRTHTGKPWETYVMSCRNEFPQGFCEFVTLGAVAYRYFHNDYFFDVYNKDAEKVRFNLMHDDWQHVYARDRDHCVECWSHGGVDRYRELLNRCVEGNPPDFVVK